MTGHDLFLRCSFSPCGTYVLGGQLYGYCVVWKTDTGSVVHLYDKLGFSAAVTDVKFHPFDHIIAFTSLGDNHPVALWSFEELSTVCLVRL